MAPAGQDAAAALLTKLFNEGSGNVESITTATGATATQAISDPAAFTTTVLTLHGATPVLQLPAPVAGKKKFVYLIQDATGSRIPSYTTLGGGSVKWVGSAAPTLQTAAGKIDRVVFESYDGTNWVGAPSLNIG